MKSFNKFWQGLNGKKTTLGVVVHFIAYGLLGINLVDQEAFNTLIILGDVVMGAGLTHKVFKAFR